MATDDKSVRYIMATNSCLKKMPERLTFDLFTE